MHFEHDKHQYFFEKFLRNEMRSDELAAFEYKLNNNDRFKKDFDFYVNNRKNILEEELAEYDQNEILLKQPQKWGWFYSIVSVLSLVLIIDYYVTANYDKNIVNTVRRKPLIERMNFFRQEELPVDIKADNSNGDQIEDYGKEKSVQKNILSEPQTFDSVALFNDAEMQLQQYIESSNGVQSDFFIMDSLMWVYDGAATHERFTTLKIQTDSILDDSSVQMLAFKSLYGKPKVSQKQLFVEYWKSPIHFNGYKFSGKKLLLFGFETIDPLFFTYDEQGNNYHLFLMNKEFHLYSDNQFHKILKD